jgi:GAF domain
MRDRWVGLQAGVDARRWARLLRRAHESTVITGHPPSIVREVIADSWARCTESGVDPGVAGAPLAVDPDDARERWREHPLSRSAKSVLTVLGDLLYDARHIVVFSDADGCLLWSDGHPEVLKASEGILFCPGHQWTEAAAGTNAIGTALAADHAVQVFSAEHYRAEVHGWQCSGAPVHDPETGRTLGVIDVTGSYWTAHPHNLALVQMAARMVENDLRAEMLERDFRIVALFAQHTARHGGLAAALSPSGRVLAVSNSWHLGPITISDDDVGLSCADGVDLVAEPLGEGTLLLATSAPSPAPRFAGLRLELLGRRRAEVTGPGGTRRLTARHSEIVAVLALHPEGLDARELAELVYDEAGHEVSVRTELHRLREIFGPALTTRPYRLENVEIDLCQVEALLRDGCESQANGRYPGPLLPASKAAEIVSARDTLQARMDARMTTGSDT